MNRARIATASFILGGCLLAWNVSQAQSYAAWQAAHPNVAAEVADLKAKTTQLIDKYQAQRKPVASASEAPPYTKLVERSHKLSSAQRKQVAELMASSMQLWQAQNYSAAETAYRRVLDLDPANAEANYYYADCLVRRRKTSSGAEFMNRAALLGANTPIAEQANAALDSVPAAPGFGPPPQAAAGGAGPGGPNGTPMIAAGGPPPGAGGPPGAGPQRRGMGPPRPQLTLRQQIPLPAAPGAEQAPVIWQVTGAIKEIRDCADCPVMTVIPAGEFSMGSPVTEADRDASESPLHRVTIAYPFAVGTYPVMRGEYAQFVAETNWPDPEECIGTPPGQNFPTEIKGLTWKNPGFPQSERSAAVCVNWQDAEAYVAWLSKKAGHIYRLLSEAEYEYANRAGTTTAYWWGNDIGIGKANCDGCGGAGPKQTLLVPTAINPFGLYDMNGNIWEMTADCYHDNYVGAPSDGSAWMAGTCERRVLKGGSFVNTPDYVRSAVHFRVMSEVANHTFLGFRVARTL